MEGFLAGMLPCSDGWHDSLWQVQQKFMGVVAKQSVWVVSVSVSLAEWDVTEEFLVC